MGETFHLFKQSVISTQHSAREHSRLKGYGKCRHGEERLENSVKRSLNFFNLLCVAEGVDGDHQQHFVAVHRSDNGMRGDFAAQVFVAGFDELYGTFVSGLEMLECRSQSGELSRRP